jgi:hypothetical protein
MTTTRALILMLIGATGALVVRVWQLRGRVGWLEAYAATLADRQLDHLVYAHGVDDPRTMNLKVVKDG